MAQANDPTPVASQPASPDLAAPSKTVAPLDPFAIEMLDILALNLSAHILAHIPPSQHAQAWKHFCQIMLDPTKACDAAQRHLHEDVNASNASEHIQ